MNERKQFHGYFEQFIGLDGMNVKVDSDLFAALFDEQPILFFHCRLLLLNNRLGDFVEIFLIKLLEFGPEYFGENFVNLNEMAEFDHTIRFVDDQVLEVLKVKNFIFQELMNSAWGSDDYVGFALADDSELFLFWHTTNDGYYGDIALDMFEYLADILLDLLGKFSGRSNN